MANFKSVSNEVLKIGYKILCFFLFRNESKYIFYSFPDASDNSFYLYKYIANLKRGSTFVWLCEDPEASYDKLKLHIGPNKLIVVHKRSLRGILHFCTSRFAFTTTNFYPFFVKGRGPTVVGCWHGMPIKVIGSYKENNKAFDGEHFDYMTSTSRFYSEVMSIALSVDKNKVLPHGLPRNDGLLSISKSAKVKMFESFKIKNNEKIVFWLPTYRKSFESYGHDDSASNSFADEWEFDFFDKLNTWAFSVNTIVLIKLHPADNYNQYANFKYFESLRIITAEEWQNIGVDLYEALSVSDGLISDVSSVIIDYLVVNKPIAILSNAIDFYSRGIIPAVKPVLNCFFSIKSEQDFKYFIENLGAVILPDDNIKVKYNNQSVQRESACELIVKELSI